MGDEKTELATLFADYLQLEGWVYEGVQADIFDRLLAVLPYFELRLFR